MPQDTFTLRLSAKELNETLQGGKINKISQPRKEELSLLIYTGKRTVKLTLNANASDCGVYFTQDVQENPLVAPNFCMLLRKHLTGAEILGVEIDGFERILVIRVKCYSDFSVSERELRAEIMGKYSNLILVENGVILGAMKTTSLDEGVKRAILPGVKYTLPEAQDKINPKNFSALSELLQNAPENKAEFLSNRVAGLAPCTARQIVQSYTGGDFATHVYEYIFSDELAPRVEERGGTVVDFYARANTGIPFGTLSEAQAYFYEKRRAKKLTEELRRKLYSAVNATVKKQQKRLAQSMEKRQACEGAELNRVKGELITANLYRLERGMKSCELENYYADNAPVKILLDETLTPAQNAQNYYKRYRKQKRTLEFLLPQEEETRAELEYALSLLTAVEKADSVEDMRSLEEELLAVGYLREQAQKGKQQKKAEIPFRSYEKEGFRIFAGRNNLQNEKLVRSSHPEDIWLHAQKYHSCHVVIKTEGRVVPDSVLEYASALCAKYSDGKGGRIPVDYCPIKNLKKPPKSKAGFVIYNDYKTILIDPLE